jgi:hypothetical protein
MSVEDRSCFSYQVAAGSTTSDSRVLDVIRKSAESSRSSLPSGGSSRQVTSIGRTSPSLAITLEWVPSRYLRKYSLPLAEEPNRLERHSVSTRGQFCGASTSSTENRSPPLMSSEATYAPASSACPASTAAVAWSARSSGFASNCG